MKRKLLVVLYFVNGAVVSDAAYEDAEKYGQGYSVRFRNALKIGKDETIEPFDIVDGAVPDRYAEKYAEQGEPVTPETKQISAEGVDPKSPVAPKAADGDSKPKQPTPKPGAGWKPNA